MLTTHIHELPKGDNWIYEPKYDGFRCLLIASKNTYTLQSRNGKDLSAQFPEIINELLPHNIPLESFILDCELVYLTSTNRSDFSKVQKRAKLRTKQTINKYAREFPCTLMVFDMLLQNQKELMNLTLKKRKQYLESFFQSFKQSIIPLQIINTFLEPEPLIRQLTFERGEGVVAKRSSSSWQAGKRSPEWLKWKLPKLGTVILTHYQSSNDYFTGQIYHKGSLLPIVSVSHGFSEEKRKTLIQMFKEKGKKLTTNQWELPPGICADIVSIGLDDLKMREPKFHDFNFDVEPSACTLNQIRKQLIFPADYMDLTHPDKPIWKDVNKSDYIYYLQCVAAYLLPFLQDRLLTVIRYPHGGGKERFYQKNRPTSAPDYVESVVQEDSDYILCNQVDTLLWLGNQLALEFHVPFQKYNESGPGEIVIDLDPPSIDEFHLAVHAAKLAKAALDYFQLKAFVKTSGGKGLQLYIPLPLNRYSYKETRSFTLFLCQFLCEQQPELFTLERLKKKRAGRLYLDYLQHDEGKTMIAPYSARGETGYIATPLEWEELDDHSLHPSQFTIWTVLERLEKQKDPFRDYHLSRTEQPFTEVLKKIEKQTISN